MKKKLMEQITNEIEKLGEEIECIEVDETFTDVFIKIQESERIEGDFYIVGYGDTLEDSLKEILIGDDGIQALKNEIKEVEDDWKAEEETRKDTDKWLKAQGWG